MQELFFSFVKSSGINSNISREYFLRLYAGQQLVDRHSDEFLCTIVSDNRSSVFNDLIRLNDHESVLVLGEPVHKGKTFKQIEVFTDLIGDDKQFFKRLDGEFVILVINPTHQEITIYTSKLGLIPVYIFLRNKGIIITTRLGIIYQMVEKIGQNQAVKMQQCIYNYCFSDQTIFQNVTLLPSASVIQISGSGKSVNKYWSVIDEMESHPLSRKDSIVCINRSLDGIINDFLSDQKEVAISLTGGWDGRLILAYALKHLSVDDILLYSFGTKDAPDVFLPERTSKKLGFKYLPVYLDDKDYQDKIVGWAKDTAYNSDGMRSIKRSHYLYAMNLLSKRTDTVISGNGGSNLIKSIKLAPSNVFNKYVLELIFSKDRFATALKQFQLLKSKYSPLFGEVTEDNFLHSFQSEELDWLYANFENEKRLVVFLTGDIERKYFGFEVQSYKHLIKNQSPFFDMRFIRDLSKTIFFGGYNYDHGQLAGLKTARFYAKLVYQNNAKLSKEITDRGFSLFDLLFPFNPMIPFNYKKAKGAGKTKQLDYFQNADLLNILISEKPEVIKNLYSQVPQDEVVSNHITITEFLNQLV